MLPRYVVANEQTIMDAISKWIETIDNIPGWKEWQRQKFIAVLAEAEDFPSLKEAMPEEFKFPPDISTQHEAVMSYLSLQGCLKSLEQCEFYFRRYPFAGLPVSKGDHLQNMCELYFSRFYEMKSRLKRCLNAVSATTAAPLNTGEVLKQFAKDFDQELRARNAIHHHDRFDDIAISGIGIADLFSSKSDKRGWAVVAHMKYRRSSREWAERVKDGAA